jgi:hypothetical protein
MILIIAMFGCSVKGTVELMKAERAYDVAQEQSLKKVDVFNWTMADAYIIKAREEYSNSHYEIAAVLARKCQESLSKIQPPQNDEEGSPKESENTSGGQ